MQENVMCLSASQDSSVWDY